MTLQLPTRGAPPSNYEYSWDNEQRASSSSSSSCVRNGHDNSKGKGKMRSGMAASSKAAPPSSAAFLQSQRGSSSMYTTRGTSSKDVDSIRALEDKLLHTAALLQNSMACERLPGGQKGVQDRFNALTDRIHHLYAVQGIDSQLRDAQLEDSSTEGDLGSNRVKKEESDPEALDEMERMSLSSDPPAVRGPRTPSRSHARAHVHAQPGSSPHSASSPSGQPRRTFKDDILDRSVGPSASGRIAHLSMQESLLLSERESARMMAQRRLEDEADEREAALAQARAEANASGGRKGAGARKAGHAGGKKVGFAGMSAYNVGSGIGARGGGTAGEGADGDDEDYDWSTEGYYDDT